MNTPTVAANIFPELFHIVWLDPTRDETRISIVEQSLRVVINSFKHFQTVVECQKFIDERSAQDRILLIVSGHLGRNIVGSIHHYRQIVSIYVHCFDKAFNEQWASNYDKIKGVIVELTDLVSQIQADYNILKIIEAPLPIGTFVANKVTDHSITKSNNHFIHTQALLECLLKLTYTQSDRQEFIQCCKRQYDGNALELQFIHDFEHNHSADTVLSLYENDTCFRKSLDAALCKQDVHAIFLFRELIDSIHRRLSYYQIKDSIKVYRSLIVSSEEFSRLTQCINQFISINSFLITTVHYQQAYDLLQTSTIFGNVEPILFEIDACPDVVINRPFSRINANSESILFMTGSIFRLNRIDQLNGGRVRLIHMVLCNENELEFVKPLKEMTEEFGSAPTNLFVLEKLLRKIGMADLAKKYLIRMLKKMPSDHPLFDCFHENVVKTKPSVPLFSTPKEVTSLPLKFKDPTELMISKSAEKTDVPLETISIPVTTRWSQLGFAVAGNQGEDGVSSNFDEIFGFCLANDNIMIIADYSHHCVLEWKIDDEGGKVIAGGNGQGSGLNQLNLPVSVVIDRKTNSLIIGDQGNARIMRWSRSSGTIEGEILINNISCSKLAIDNQQYLYVSDEAKHEVRKYRIGQGSNGIIVAGGNGMGDRLDQLNRPGYIFVDRQQAIYISDFGNNRVVRWDNAAQKGIIVAGGQGAGSALTQLNGPNGIFVDANETVYIADQNNHRIVRWLKGAKEGTLVVGGNGQGNGSTQLNCPENLTFSQKGTLYVVDNRNRRIQQFITR